ncbi:MAG TPA: TlyA family RNA methyltransferase [Candidatus Babeliales bacterium]|nr:TlyA family RNA methyltransferase [Candidatus Babeliales bacterium]
MRKRVDLLALQKWPHLSRNQIANFIVQSQLQVDGKVVTKPGTLIAETALLQLDQELPKYVSRAGFKLESALHYFKITIQDLIILDAGISTGGFTDCLLQHGAKKIYGVDVGSNQVHPKILADSRVIVLEQTNLKELAQLPELVDLVTLDLSFISVLKVIPSILKLMTPVAHLLVLIKPQFEAGPAAIKRGGIVRDQQVRLNTVQQVITGVEQLGFKPLGVCESVITGTMGNQEYLAYFVRT